MSSPQPRVGILQFPGSNDDRDALWALAALDAEAVLVWHAETELPDLDAVVLPGGFSYGDYLRCGAIAQFAPAMAAVAGFADEGGLVLGICNGFQILCEAGLLPGVLHRSRTVARKASNSRSRSSTARAAGTPTTRSTPSSKRGVRSSSATQSRSTVLEMTLRA